MSRLREFLIGALWTVCVLAVGSAVGVLLAVIGDWLHSQ